MIAGHFGFAAMVKARKQLVPLWMLMLATVWLDIVFVPLLLLGLETIVPAEGDTLRYGNALIHADYTHSLLGALALSAILGLVAMRLWGGRPGLVVGLVSFSHWVLDLLVHRADMPWLPANLGNLPRLGFGLWHYPAITAALEAALVVAGALLYWRAARGLPGAPMRANLAAALILLGGIVVLGLDVTGVLG